MTHHPLLDAERVGTPPVDFLSSIGELFAVFDTHTQDSGNISYGVRIGNERFFVKTAGDTAFSTPFANHAERSALLCNAANLYRSCEHPALAHYRHTVESDDGPLLVYDWADGELLGQDKEAPDSALKRFRRLPVEEICPVLDQIYDAHRALAKAGWIAVDFYLGSIIYDFAGRKVSLVDLDLYHSGPFTNKMGRMFGSRSVMAPEEFQMGARVDEATNAFVMGRLAFLLLADGTTDRDAFRGTDAMFDVVTTACQEDPNRSLSVNRCLCHAWERHELVTQ
jgi:serine/threonine-protein kinase